MANDCSSHVLNSHVIQQSRDPAVHCIPAGLVSHYHVLGITICSESLLSMLNFMAIVTVMWNEALQENELGAVLEEILEGSASHIWS